MAAGSRIVTTGAALLWVATLWAATGSADELPGWTAKIRRDHPRLFFNADTWPEVRRRALAEEHDWYLAIKARVDGLLERQDDLTQGEPRELGPEAARAAFLFRMTEDERYLSLAKACLDGSLRFYDRCYQQKTGKSWSIVSRGLKPESLAMMGRWRVEVAPGSPRTEDVFLHVIQVGGSDLQRMGDARLLEEEGTCGVRLTGAGATWEVTFAAEGELAGHVKRLGGKEPIDVDLTTAVQGQSGIMAKR